MRKTTESRRRTRSRDVRENQLIEAALECISALGLRDTTVQDVAERAGMAVGSINQYFESKELLLMAALRTLSEEFETNSQRRIAEAGPDAAARLRGFVEGYFEPTICQRKKVAVWFAFWGEVKGRPKYRTVCAAFDRRHDDTLEALCGALLAHSPRHDQETRYAAKIITSVCHGLWLELLTGCDGLKRGELKQLALLTLAAVFPAHAAVFLPPHAASESA